MKIEKLDRDNIKEYVRDLGMDITYNDEIDIIDTETFGVKEDDKFLFGFTSLDEDLIGVIFGKKKISDDVLKMCVNFLNNSLSFSGHLVIQISDKKIMDIMDNLYRVKLMFVNKKMGDYDSCDGNGKERFADIDMRSIKYYYKNNMIECNLYSQNIQDEDIISKLDEFFMGCGVNGVEFCILTDSYDYMKSLGYECISKRYVIE